MLLLLKENPVLFSVFLIVLDTAFGIRAFGHRRHKDDSPLPEQAYVCNAQG
jgi:hypothetical protein